MDVSEEEKLVYSLMKEIIAERRELSKQYYDLKLWLENLKKLPSNDENQSDTSTHVYETTQRNSNHVSDMKKFYGTKYKSKKIPFERIASYVVEMLKNSPTPLSNKQIHETLTNKYEIQIQYSNLTNNILPRIVQSNNYHIEKAYRGFWQFRKEKG